METFDMGRLDAIIARVIISSCAWLQEAFERSFQASRPPPKSSSFNSVEANYMMPKSQELRTKPTLQYRVRQASPDSALHAAPRISQEKTPRASTPDPAEKEQGK